jgi:hypothetical protein
MLSEIGMIIARLSIFAVALSEYARFSPAECARAEMAEAPLFRLKEGFDN